MPTQEILAKFHDIRIKPGEYDPQFKKIKSPQTVYGERASAIRSRIRHAWAQLASVLGSSAPILQDEISRFGGQLKELKIDHKAGLKVEEKKYQDQLQNTTGVLYRDLICVMEPHREESTLRALLIARLLKEILIWQLILPTNIHLLLGQVVQNKRKIDQPDILEPPERRRCGGPRRSEQLANQIPREKNASKSLSESPPRGRTRRSHRRHRNDTPTQEQDFEEITNPDPGEVYLAFWGKSQEWLAMLVLPMQHPEEVGVSGTLETLRPAEIIPLCYEYDKLTKVYIWWEGYNEG
ncbi:hypothetical protein FALCPG4_018493 [Fusarium falciforme]